MFSLSDRWHLSVIIRFITFALLDSIFHSPKLNVRNTSLLPSTSPICGLAKNKFLKFLSRMLLAPFKNFFNYLVIRNAFRKLPFFYSLQSWEGGTESCLNSIAPKKGVWSWPSFSVSLIFRVCIIFLPVFLSVYIPNISIN